MSDYRLRPATADDLPALVALRLALQDHMERCNPHHLSALGRGARGDGGDVCALSGRC